MNTPTKVEREIEELVRSKFMHPGAIDMDLQNVIDFIHHQLQKARQDWLREMEEVMRVDIGDASPTRLTLQALLDRYHSELDQDNKKLLQEVISDPEIIKAAAMLGAEDQNRVLDQDKK